MQRVTQKVHYSSADFQFVQYVIICSGMKLDFNSSYQHGSPEIVLVEELRDEDVHLENVGDVLILDVAQHVHEPLESPLRRRDPQKVHLKHWRTLLDK